MIAKIKPWLILAVIFLAGVLSGVGVSMVFSHHFMYPPRPAEMKQHVMNRLTRELQLTADQQAKIQPIVEKSIQDVEGVHVEEMGRVSQIIKDSEAQIAPLLTPDQKTRLDQIEADREKMFNGHLRMWGIPGGPPPPPPGSGPGGNPPPSPPPASAPAQAPAAQ